MAEQQWQLQYCLGQQERDPPECIELRIDLQCMAGTSVYGRELAAKSTTVLLFEQAGHTWFLTSRWYHSSLSCAFRAALRRDRVALMPIWLLSCRPYRQGTLDRSSTSV